MERDKTVETAIGSVDYFLDRRNFLTEFNVFLDDVLENKAKTLREGTLSRLEWDKNLANLRLSLDALCRISSTHSRPGRDIAELPPEDWNLASKFGIYLEALTEHANAGGAILEKCKTIQQKFKTEVCGDLAQVETEMARPWLVRALLKFWETHQSKVTGAYAAVKLVSETNSTRRDQLHDINSMVLAPLNNLAEFPERSELFLSNDDKIPIKHMQEELRYLTGLAQNALKKGRHGQEYRDCVAAEADFERMVQPCIEHYQKMQLLPKSKIGFNRH